MKVLNINKEGNVKLEFNEEHHFLVVSAKAKVTFEDYKAVIEAMGAAVESYNCKRVIFNIREMTHSDATSRSWLTLNFLPKLFKKHGTDFSCGIVKSKSIFENLTAEFMAKTVMTLGFRGEIKFFEDENATFEWIKSVEKEELVK